MRSTTDGIEIKFELFCGMAMGKWGCDAQKLKALEELNELSAALAKTLNLNSGANLRNVTSEIVDVKIMLRQLEVMFDVTPDDVEAALDKLKARIEQS